MEAMYDHPTAEPMSPDGLSSADDLHGLLAAATGLPRYAAAAEREEMKARIASHPTYPRLLQAYIDCQKVGAPPAIASLLDEIQKENESSRRGGVSSVVGADPELDEFMETYCDVLVKYRSDLARPFDEATTFLNTIEMQLSDLCKPSSRTISEDH